jgi:hypothetical protein
MEIANEWEWRRLDDAGFPLLLSNRNIFEVLSSCTCMPVRAVLFRQTTVVAVDGHDALRATPMVQ